MATSNTKPKMCVKAYSCEVATCDFQTKYKKCGEFLSGLDDNSTLSIWLKHTSKSSARIGDQIRVHRDVDVLVRKTNREPVRVQLKLQITQTQSAPDEQCKKLNFWRGTCHFPNLCFSSLSDEPQYQILLKIAWNLPDPEDSGIRGSPYLRMPDFLPTDSLKDVKIIFGEEMTEAHKLILSAASPVLHAMITSPMEEGLENCVVIKDIDVNIMRIVLKVLYTAQDDDLAEIDIALQVLAVAERYDMKALKHKCERKLLGQVSITNAIQMLDVADTYGADILKTRCMNFLIAHQREIIKSEYLTDIFVRKPSLMIHFTVAVVNSRALSYLR